MEELVNGGENWSNKNYHSLTDQIIPRVETKKRIEEEEYLLEEKTG